MKLIRKILPLWTTTICFSLFILQSCKNSSGTNEEEKEMEEKIVLKPAPDFNADSAYFFVEKQVKFGPRVPNSPGHRNCGDYLLQTLKDFGFEITAQNFDAIAYDGTVLKSRNIIGSFNPGASARILLSAHWDTRPYNDKEVKDSAQFKPIDGANDAASGVAVLLEVARAIHQAKIKPTVGVDIIFFDSEDYGTPENYKGPTKADTWCLGSQYWSKNKHKADYSAYYGILLDMVGGKGAQFYQEGSSMQYAAEVTSRVWRTAIQLGFGNYFKRKNSPAITDDHIYVNTIAKIPMTNIVDFDPANADSFFRNWHHTSKDNLEIIDKNTLKAVGQTVLQVLYNESTEAQ